MITRPLFLVFIETGWLLVLAAFAFVCVLPLREMIAQDFVRMNALLALLFAFYFRQVIFFRQIVYLKFLAVQIVLFLLNPVLFVKVLGNMQEMLFIFDSHDLYHFIIPGISVPAQAMNDAYHFFRNEFLLFSVGLMILLAFAELRIALIFIDRVRKMD